MSIQSAYISLFEFFPEDDEQLSIKLSDTHTKVATAVNAREIGFYQNAIEVPTGQQFSASTGSGQRQTFRKVFYFGAALAGATTTIAHGLSSVVCFTKLTGTVCTASDFRPIPYMSVSAVTAGIELRADATNVYVLNGTTAPAITSGIVILEYLYT